MFTVVVDRPRRRIWSPRTAAISAFAHLFVLLAFVAAAEAAPDTPEPRVVLIPLITPRATPQQQPAPRQAPPKPVGTTRVVQEVTEVPRVLPPVDPHQTPTNDSDYNGHGPAGDSIGTPNSAPPSAGSPSTDPLPSWSADDVIDVEKADVRPEFANRSEAQRTLERAYPPLLRDAEVSGRTLVTMIIGRDGRVEPGSVSVQESTNDAFRDAAIRAAERFRFRPAQYRGQTVAVVISLPIDWQIAH